MKTTVTDKQQVFCFPL